MRYLNGLMFKWMLITGALLFVFGAIYDAPLGPVFLIAAIYTVFTYLGDVFLLPAVRNRTGTLGDLVLAFLGLWLLGSVFLPEGRVSVVPASVIASVIIAGAEWYFHIFMMHNVFYREPR